MLRVALGLTFMGFQIRLRAGTAAKEDNQGTWRIIGVNKAAIYVP